MYGGDIVTISILHRHDNATTYREDIMTISSQKNIVSTSFRCCYYDDDFSKKLQISILHRHDSATTYCKDIVTISSQRNIVSASFRCCYYDDFYRNLKFSNDSISMLLRYRYDIVAMSFHYSIEMILKRYRKDIATI
jgi:hypothetical protein